MANINLDFVKDTMEKIVTYIDKSKKEKEMLTPEPTDVIQNIKLLHKEVLEIFSPDSGLFVFKSNGTNYAISRGGDAPSSSRLYLFNGIPEILLATFDLEDGGFNPEPEFKDCTFGQAEQFLKDLLATLKERDITETEILRALNKDIRKALTSNKDGTPFEWGNKWYYISRGRGNNESSNLLIISTRHKDRLEVVFHSNTNIPGILDIHPGYRTTTTADAIGMLRSALEALSVKGLVETLTEAGMFPEPISLQEHVTSCNAALKELTKKPYRRDVLEVIRNGEIVLNLLVYPDSWSLGFNDGEGQEFHNFIASRLDNTYQRTIYSKQKEVTELDIHNILKLMLDNINSFDEASTIGVINLDENKITFRRDLDRDFLLFTDKFKAKYKCSGKIRIVLDGVGELSYEYDTRDKFIYRAAGTHIDIGFRVMSGGGVRMRPDVPNSSDYPLSEGTMQTLKLFL